MGMETCSIRVGYVWRRHQIHNIKLSIERVQRCFGMGAELYVDSNECGCERF